MLWLWNSSQQGFYDGQIPHPKIKPNEVDIHMYCKVSNLCKSDYNDLAEYYGLPDVCQSEPFLQMKTSDYAQKKTAIWNQNPSDSKSTFRNKAHRGYAASLEQSVGANGSVVTECQYAQDNHSNSQFIWEHLERMDKTLLSHLVHMAE